MNLFLGYYLPYSHTVPLWEQETDYYLHNVRVKAGKGTMYTMKTYRRAFGIDWEEGRRNVNESESQSSTLKSSRIKNILRLQQEESSAVKRVRHRCGSQNEALSSWWKIALQSHIKQRMWMQIGHHQNDFILPSRFERLYQPDKIGQFDRYFARGWATPARRSHAAQHSDGPESESDSANLLRVVSQDFTKHSNAESADEPRDEEGNTTVEAFIKRSGYEPQIRPSLSSLLNHHEANRTKYDLKYLGHFDRAEEVPRDEYLNYVGDEGQRSLDSQSYAPEKVEEFKRCLHDYTMSSDDVAGIHAVRFS